MLINKKPGVQTNPDRLRTILGPLSKIAILTDDFAHHEHPENELKVLKDPLLGVPSVTKSLSYLLFFRAGTYPTFKLNMYGFGGANPHVEVLVGGTKPI